MACINVNAFILTGESGKIMKKEILKPFERIQLAFEHKEADRVPIYDLFCGDGVIEQFAGERPTVENGLDVACIALRNSVDMTRAVGGPQKPGIRRDSGDKLFGGDGFAWENERWTSWIVDYPHRTHEERVSFIRRSIEKHNAWENDCDGSIKEYIEHHQSIQEKLGDTIFLWEFEGAGLTKGYLLLGIQQFCLMMYDEPDLISEWLEAMCNCHVRRIHSLFNAVKNTEMFKTTKIAFAGEDIAFKDALIFPHEFLRKEFFPRLKKLIDAYHEHGLKVIFHSDGDINSIIDDIVEAGADGLNPIEKAAGMDIYDLKKKHGDKLTFCGGMDVTYLLREGTPEAIKAETRRMVKEVGKGGGFCIGSSTEIGNDIPGENVAAMVNVVKEMGTI